MGGLQRGFTLALLMIFALLAVPLRLCTCRSKKSSSGKDSP